MSDTIIPCRLCNAESNFVFTLPVLGKYPVRYFKCQGCGSLETEDPFWLAEAYGDDVHPEDRGYLTRNLLVYENMRHLLRVLEIPQAATILDYGGGLGLVPRLLRENGYNAFSFDTYTKTPFANCEWDKTPPTFVLAIELFEHLPNPKEEAEIIFGSNPEYVYVRTWRYFGQGSDWSYIGPSHGEHVFLYTDEAMRFIAKSHGYEVLLPNSVDAFFYRSPISKDKMKEISRGISASHFRISLRNSLRLGMDVVKWRIKQALG
jgi:Methyltransferase domain